MRGGGSGGVRRGGGLAGTAGARVTKVALGDGSGAAAALPCMSAGPRGPVHVGGSKRLVGLCVLGQTSGGPERRGGEGWVRAGSKGELVQKEGWQSMKLLKGVFICLNKV